MSNPVYFIEKNLGLKLVQLHPGDRNPDRARWWYLRSQSGLVLREKERSAKLRAGDLETEVGPQGNVISMHVKRGVKWCKGSEAWVTAPGQFVLSLRFPYRKTEEEHKLACDVWDEAPPWNDATRSHCFPHCGDGRLMLMLSEIKNIEAGILRYNADQPIPGLVLAPAAAPPRTRIVWGTVSVLGYSHDVAQVRRRRHGASTNLCGGAEDAALVASGATTDPGTL